MRVDALRELWLYRELFYFLVWRVIKVRYKQTALGALWAVIQPLLTMIVFTLVFGKLAKLPNEGIPYPIFYYSALLPWIYFANALTSSSNSLVANVYLVSKIYFPRFLLPASAVLASLVDLAVATLLLFVLMWYYGTIFTWQLLLWPVFIAPLVLLALGVGLFLSALNVNYRDVKYTIPFLVQLWLFASPVIYPISFMPEKYRALVVFNPTAGLIEGSRNAIVGRPVDWHAYGISVALVLAIFVLGYLYFSRTERQFADVI